MIMVCETRYGVKSQKLQRVLGHQNYMQNAMDLHTNKHIHGIHVVKTRQKIISRLKYE